MKQHKLPFPVRFLERSDGIRRLVADVRPRLGGDFDPGLIIAECSLALGEVLRKTNDFRLRLPRDFSPLLEMSCFLGWDYCGRNSFMFSPYVSECLRETDLKNVPTSAVRLPYPVIWMGMPGVYSKITTGKKFGEVKASGFFLSKQDVYDGWGGMFVPESRDHGIKTGKRSSALVVYVMTETGNAGSISIPLIEPTIEECLTPLDTPIKGIAREYLRAAINAVLYLSAPNADLQPVVPILHGATMFSGKKKRRKAARAAKARTVMVGYRFTKVKNKDQKASTSESGRRRVRLHRVRGHWRMVACGEGRAERRPRWIAPHWSGTRREETERAAYIVSGD